jgi:hypothetical protein
VELVTAIATAAVPIASVAASAWVAVKTKLIDAAARKADRQHEGKLAYEQRAWDLKNSALATLIGASYQVLLQAQLSERVEISARRARVVRAMDGFRDRIGGERGIIGQLLAYAADPVRQAVDDLLDKIEAERNRHLMELYVLSRLEPDREEVQAELRPGPRPDGPAVMTVDVYERLTDLSTAISRQMSSIGDRSQLDIEDVVAQCIRVIDAARDDLHAKPVEGPQPQRRSWVGTIARRSTTSNYGGHHGHT